MVLVALVHTDSSLGTTPYLGWNTSTACLFPQNGFPSMCNAESLFEPCKSIESLFTLFLMADSAYLKS